jgi:hypothetical protein
VRHVRDVFFSQPKNKHAQWNPLLGCMNRENPDAQRFKWVGWAAMSRIPRAWDPITVLFGQQGRMTWRFSAGK